MSGAVSSNAQQYTGRENDGTGLYYYRNRYYLPDCGRFISEDPAGMRGGLNKYGYVSGDPINASDPYGLWSTAAHNRILQLLFGDCISGPDLADIMRGSLDVDGGEGLGGLIWAQAVGDPAEHAMRGDFDRREAAERRMIDFINRELRLAETDPSNWMFHIGRALHPIMNSTSPLHQDFPLWDPMSYGATQHGERGEGVRLVTPEVIGRVRDAIRRWAPGFRGVCYR